MLYEGALSKANGVKAALFRTSGVSALFGVHSLAASGVEVKGVSGMLTPRSSRIKRSSSSDVGGLSMKEWRGVEDEEKW